MAVAILFDEHSDYLTDYSKLSATSPRTNRSRAYLNRLPAKRVPGTALEHFFRKRKGFIKLFCRGYFGAIQPL